MTTMPTTVAVIVTYNPALDAFGSLLHALQPQVTNLIVVDNGSDNAEEIRNAVKRVGAHFIGLPENQGIAAAQNRGITWAGQQGATRILLSDQDSLPAADMVRQLDRCLDEAEKQGVPVAAVGPVPLDERGDTSEALVYSFTRWGAKRRGVPSKGETLSVPFVLASGCLIPLGALADVGPMNESLFIDHVDLAWCLRAIQKGYQVIVCGDATLQHSLGDQVATVPGRRRLVHLHSPTRNYYMMRNTVFLQRAKFLPLAWKLGYLVWMTKYMGYYLLLVPGRRQRATIFAQAVADGRAGRGGPLPRSTG